MCTLTLTPSTAGHAARLVVNRDELHTRPDAWPPEVRAFGQHAALMPIDPQAGGTWVGVNDAGLCFSLLNRTPVRRLTGGRPNATSRGTIIPGLLKHHSVDDALADALRLDYRDYDLFRLLITNGQRVVEVDHEGNALAVAMDQAVDRPMMWASSSWGDSLVDAPRRELFDQMLGGTAPDAWRDAIDAFHVHRWPERGELSVYMQREDACSVSRTDVTLGEERVTMRYVPLPGGEWDVTTELALPRGRSRAARG